MEGGPRLVSKRSRTDPQPLPDLRLSAELLETGARRLRILALVTAATFLLFGMAHAVAGLWLQDPRSGRLALWGSVCGIVISSGTFGLTRLWRRRSRRLPALAVAFQIAMAVVIGIVDNSASLEHVQSVRGWSGLAVWIFIFAVFVPSSPARTLWVSTVVAVLDPATMLVDAALGYPMPSWLVLPQVFAPTLVAVVTAVIAARIHHRLTGRLREARELGSYRLVEPLGHGGMGEVWRAEHRMLARPAAVKLIRAEVLATGTGDSSQGLLRRFEREAQATALLRSENTIEVYDFGVSDEGLFYYVMELLDGLDLERMVEKFGPMPPERVVHCLIGVCDSLAEAHAAGLVHRDIKPSNVFLCRKGLRHDCVKVLDFGLVTAVAPAAEKHGWQSTASMGLVAGTPAYMAPEIIEGGRDIDGRADLYALGCVAYFLLSGAPVFDGGSAAATILKHLSAEPPPLGTRAKQDIPAALEQIVHACLEKDPARRPRGAEELRLRLEETGLATVWTRQSAREWWEKTGSASGPPAAPVAGASETHETVRQRPPRPGPV